MKQSAKKPKKPMGRPSLKTKELCDGLVRHIADAGTVSSYARQVGIHRTVLHDWIRDDPELSRQIARARDIGCELLQDDGQDLVDKAKPETAALVKLKLFWIEKRMVWHQPAKYGSKVQVGGAPDLPPLSLTAEERRAKVLAILQAAKRKERHEEAKAKHEAEAEGPQV